MKKKYIDGTDLDLDWLEKYTSKYKYLDDEEKGYVSLIKFEKVKFKITVDYDSSDGAISILDEDELQEALNLGIINKTDFQLAKKTCQQVIKEVIPDDKFMKDFFYKHLETCFN